MSALSALVGGGADCGPSNPLAQMSKQFGNDRGAQQVSRRALAVSSPLQQLTRFVVAQDHYTQQTGGRNTVSSPFAHATRARR